MPRQNAATGSVTDFTDPAALEEALLRTTWSAYEHPAVAPGCVAFWTSEIPGTPDPRSAPRLSLYRPIPAGP